MTEFPKFSGTLRSTAVAFAGPPSPTGVIGGVAMHFNTQNDNGWAVAAGAFDLASSHPPAMLWSHEPANVIGSWNSVQVVGNSLRVQGQLNLAVERARETLALLSNGDVTGLSVGLSVKPDDVERADNGWLFKRAKLSEVSVVAVPADPSARISTVASGIRSIRDYEHFLRDAGFARSLAARLSRAWPKDEQANEIEAAIERVNALTTRRADIIRRVIK